MVQAQPSGIDSDARGCESTCKPRRGWRRGEKHRAAVAAGSKPAPGATSYERRRRIRERFGAGTWASQPPMHPAHLAAALGDRGDTGEFLNLSGAVVAVTLRTEGGRSPDAGPSLTSTWAGCQRGRDPDAGQRVSPAPTRAGLPPRSPRSVARPAAPAP